MGGIRERSGFLGPQRKKSVWKQLVWTAKVEVEAEGVGWDGWEREGGRGGGRYGRATAHGAGTTTLVIALEMGNRYRGEGEKNK